MRRRRMLTVAAVTALAVAAGAAAALGHSEVVSTSPANGSTAKTSISRASVTFGEAMRRGTIRVVGPGGKVVSIGTGGRDPRKVSRIAVGLRKPLAVGRYTATWTAVAADGHHQRGTFGFRLRR